MTVGVERPAGAFAASAEAEGRNCVHPSRAAFTLLEIMLALLLMALLTAATISVSVNLVGTPATPEEVFWQSLAEARKQALVTQQEVRLGFDGKGKAFLVGVNVGMPASADPGPQTGANASTEATDDPGAQRFPVAKASDKLAVDFLPTGKSNSSMLIGGDLIETDPMHFVTFYGDGTCTPFRVQFHSIGPAHIISIDPWTCTEVLEEKK